MTGVQGMVIDGGEPHSRDPAAVVIERNVLAWRLDPTSDARTVELSGPDHLIVVLCSEGYASSLAAVSLHAVGLRGATDVIGGFRAWAAAGLPTRRESGGPGGLT